MQGTRKGNVRRMKQNGWKVGEKCRQMQGKRKMQVQYKENIWTRKKDIRGKGTLWKEHERTIKKYKRSIHEINEHEINLKVVRRTMEGQQKESEGA